MTERKSRDETMGALSRNDWRLVAIALAICLAVVLYSDRAGRAGCTAENKGGSAVLHCHGKIDVLLPGHLVLK